MYKQTIKSNKLVLFKAYPQLFKSDDNSFSFNFIAIPNENTTFLIGIQEESLTSLENKFTQ